MYFRIGWRIDQGSWVALQLWSRQSHCVGVSINHILAHSNQMAWTLSIASFYCGRSICERRIIISSIHTQLCFINRPWYHQNNHHYYDSNIRNNNKIAKWAKRTLWPRKMPACSLSLRESFSDQTFEWSEWGRPICALIRVGLDAQLTIGNDEVINADDKDTSEALRRINWNSPDNNVVGTYK